MRPVCTVCIANYNGMKIIEDCIDAVLAQDAKFSYEIIVHDDASTDQSLAYVRNRYPQVTIIESRENVGFCVSNNRMAEAARGEYLLLLNNDAILFPDALRTLHEHASRQTTPGILGLPQYDAQTNVLLDIGSLTDPFLNSVPNKKSEREDVAMVAGACLWIPSVLWKKIGGFPSWFHTLAEDLFICSVARLWNYPVQALPQSGFRHWVGRSIGGGKVTEEHRLSTSRQRRRLTERNKTYVMCMVYPATLLAFTLPLHLLLLYFEGLMLSLFKRDVRIWKEIYYPIAPSIWRTRHLLLSSRKNIQSSRKVALQKFIHPFCLMPHKLRMLIQYGMPEIK